MTGAQRERLAQLDQSSLRRVEDVTEVDPDKLVEFTLISDSTSGVRETVYHMDDKGRLSSS